MAADKMKEILKHFPDLEDGWKEMEERFKADPAEREMLSLRYQQMLEMERLKENLPEPEFTKTKKAETTSKVTSKVSDDLEEAARRYAKSKHTDEVLQKIVVWDFMAGAKWQKERIMENSTNATIGLPYENKYGGYTHLIDVSRPLSVGNNIIAIIFKED